MAGAGEVERWSGLRAWLYSLIQGNAARNRFLVEYAGVGPGDRVLDIGCGPGASLQEAVRAKADYVAGVDPSPSMVRPAANRVPEAEIREGSAESVPFEDDEFTAVWAISAYHHWADTDAGITEMLRVLKPGGAFYIVERELKPGSSGHGASYDDAIGIAADITEKFDVPAKVDTLGAGRARYLVVTGSK